MPLLGEWERENLYNREVMGVDFVEGMQLENITIPQSTYVIFETDYRYDPLGSYFDILDQRISILTEWMPEMGFQLVNAPELVVYHWIPKHERHLQIWMPVEKIR